jgi:hypothetical protein
MLLFGHSFVQTDPPELPARNRPCPRRPSSASPARPAASAHCAPYSWGPCRRWAPNRSKQTSGCCAWKRMLQASVFKCFRCFRGMLQVFYMDVAKVDRDVSYVAMVVHILPSYLKIKLFWTATRSLKYNFDFLFLWKKTFIKIFLWKYFSRQIYWYGFHISKLNNQKVIHDLYF